MLGVLGFMFPNGGNLFEKEVPNTFLTSEFRNFTQKVSPKKLKKRSL